MIETKTKRCTICLEEKALSDFHNVRGYPQGRCRTCNRSYMRAYFYGIREDEYQHLLQRQNGACAICQIPEADAPKSRLHVDHDHESDRVRGLLCSNCNTGLGLFKDNPLALASALQYLGQALN